MSGGKKKKKGGGGGGGGGSPTKKPASNVSNINSSSPSVNTSTSTSTTSVNSSVNSGSTPSRASSSTNTNTTTKTVTSTNPITKSAPTSSSSSSSKVGQGQSTSSSSSSVKSPVSSPQGKPPRTKKGQGVKGIKGAATATPTAQETTKTTPKDAPLPEETCLDEVSLPIEVVKQGASPIPPPPTTPTHTEAPTETSLDDEVHVVGAPANQSEGQGQSQEEKAPEEEAPGEKTTEKGPSDKIPEEEGLDGENPCEEEAPTENPESEEALGLCITTSQSLVMGPMVGGKEPPQEANLSCSKEGPEKEGHITEEEPLAQEREEEVTFENPVMEPDPPVVVVMGEEPPVVDVDVGHMDQEEDNAHPKVSCQSVEEHDEENGPTTTAPDPPIKSFDQESEREAEAESSKIIPEPPPLSPLLQASGDHSHSHPHSSPLLSPMRGADGEFWEDDDDPHINHYLQNQQHSAEARLAARRQARAEARDIRMKELEKAQKESDENADRGYDLYAPPTTGSGGGSAGDVVNRAAFRVAVGGGGGGGGHVGVGPRSSVSSYHSSRRSSEDSSEDGVINLRELKHELKEVEEKFRKSMVGQAQLDNEKAALTYEVELLKDRLEDLEEAQALLTHAHRDKCRDYDHLKRLSTQLKDEGEWWKAETEERDALIKGYGLVLIDTPPEAEGERPKRALVSQATATVLSSLGNGSLDVRLSKVLEEKNELVDEIRRLKMDLEEERALRSGKPSSGGLNLNNNINHNHLHDEENETEISKQLADYRFKTQKYEQEVAALQANVTRLDTQVVRFKTAAEEAEAREDDLKVERRKLQRDLREAQSKLDEVETTNSHLQKRLDKLKTAKSTLLKEL